MEPFVMTMLTVVAYAIMAGLTHYVALKRSITLCGCEGEVREDGSCTYGAWHDVRAFFIALIWPISGPVMLGANLPSIDWSLLAKQRQKRALARLDRQLELAQRERELLEYRRQTELIEARRTDRALEQLGLGERMGKNPFER